VTTSERDSLERGVVRLFDTWLPKWGALLVSP